MGAPTEVRNELDPATVAPGGTSTWFTEARDPDSRNARLARAVRDSAGHATTMTSVITVLDEVTYDDPTCDDPRVTLTVDPDDPRIVHIAAAAG